MTFWQKQEKINFVASPTGPSYIRDINNLAPVESEELVAKELLNTLGIGDGIYIESEREYGMGLETTLQYGDTSYTCAEMLGIAMSVAGQGRYSKALRLNANAIRSAVSFGSWIPEEIPIVFWHEMVVKLIHGTREKLGEELTNQYEEQGRAMSFDDAVKYALNFDID